MVMVDVNASCQLSSVGSQPKSVGLVRGLAGTQRLVCIHEINQVNSRNGSESSRQHLMSGTVSPLLVTHNLLSDVH